MNDHPLNSLMLVTACFRLKASDNGKLPSWLGSTIRGAFGMSLKKLSCTHTENSCRRCFLRDSCAYSVLFESLIPSNSKRLKKQDKIPHPMIIRPLSSGGRFTEGQVLDFEILLIGNTNKYFPAVVDAAEHMGKLGMGKSKLKFHLDSVRGTGKNNVKLWSKNSNGSVLGKPNIVAVSQIRHVIPPSKNVAIKLLTPLKLTRNGRLIEEPTFRDITRSILTRISTLLYFHCGTDLEQHLDFKETLIRAKEVRLAGIRTKRKILKRWSNRQKRFIHIHAIEGELKYKGAEIQPLWPYLLAGQHVHMGKSTSLGLGRYRIEP